MLSSGILYEHGNVSGALHPFCDTVNCGMLCVLRVVVPQVLIPFSTIHLPCQNWPDRDTTSGITAIIAITELSSRGCCNILMAYLVIIVVKTWVL